MTSLLPTGFIVDPTTYPHNGDKQRSDNVTAICKDGLRLLDQSLGNLTMTCIAGNAYSVPDEWSECVESEPMDNSKKFEILKNHS